MGALTRPIAKLGDAAIGTVSFIGALGILLAQAFAASPRLVFRKRGRRLAWRNLWFQAHRVGVKSIGVVALVTFSIGVILALQIVPILEGYGVPDQIATIIAIAFFRELGPLVGAIVLTGFAGASIAAEIGTMAVNEELKALRSHALSPVRFLVVPRVLAATVMTVCLAVLSSVMGIAGALAATMMITDIRADAYMELTYQSIDAFDVSTGLIKAAVFGMLIAGMACHLGLGVRGGASGVGNATTRTVVLSIVALTVVDLAFTAVFYLLGL
ncbi:MAG: MlaE family ABC transporter permease [Phycisphaerales bacterium JB063]